MGFSSLSLNVIMTRFRPTHQRNGRADRQSKGHPKTRNQTSFHPRVCRNLRRRNHSEPTAADDRVVLDHHQRLSVVTLHHLEVCARLDDEHVLLDEVEHFLGRCHIERISTIHTGYGAIGSNAAFIHTFRERFDNARLASVWLDLGKQVAQALRFREVNFFSHLILWLEYMHWHAAHNLNHAFAFGERKTLHRVKTTIHIGHLQYT